MPISHYKNASIMYIVCRPRIKSVKQLIITISVMKCSVNLDLITSKLNMLS